ncbi:MAG: tetratricopeptide repeat protein [Candidatus Bathyarchaeota archaeon]|nr:tetratricopeptide repeat protein [Candidatus Bathyarchaeota archaeon]
MPKPTDIFVGRKDEINQFFQFLEKNENSAFVVVGEPGIGKTCFLKKMVNDLKSNDKYIVGYHEVLFSADAPNPFVGVLQNLIDDLSFRDETKTKTILKRVTGACRSIVINKRDKIAGALIKDAITKLAGEHITKELQEFKKELDKTETIFTISNDFVSRYANEFINGFIDVLNDLHNAFPDKEFILLIDQFERAPLPAYNIFLDFVRICMEKTKLLIALKVEEHSFDKFDHIKPQLEGLKATSTNLKPLTVNDIKEWMIQVGKDFSDTELREIEKLSAGFPFAISEWTRSSEHLELEELKKVRGRFCEFIKWRMKNLRDECNIVARKLSVLINPLSIEDYEKVMDLQSEEFGLFVEKLVDKWILARYGDTYWFRHELIRFCLERSLTQTEKKSYNLNAARLFQDKYNEMLKTKQKVDTSTGWGCAHYWHKSGKHKESLGHNLRFGHFCISTGLLDLAEKAYSYALEDAKAIDDTNAIMTAKGNMAAVYRQWGRFDEALATYYELFEYSRKTGDKQMESVALHQIGVVKQELGNYDEAEKRFQESLDLAQITGDVSGMASTLHHLGIMEHLKGNIDKALSIYQQSLDASKQIEGKLDNQLAIARTLHQIGRIQEERGNYHDALKLYEESIEIKQRVGDKRGTAGTLHQLGVIEHRLGNYKEALDLYFKSLKIRQEIGDKIGIADSLGQIGMIEQDRGNYEKAMEKYLESLEIAQKFNDQTRVAKALHQMGNVKLAQLDLIKAVEFYQKSLEIENKLGNQSGIAKTLHQIGMIKKRQGKYKEAFELYNKSIEMHQRIGDKSGIAASLHQIGKLYESMNLWEFAADYYKKAIEIFREIGETHNFIVAMKNYTKVKERIC